VRHARRASLAGRFPPSQPPLVPVAQPPSAPATGLLRRLSMGSSFASRVRSILRDLRPCVELTSHFADLQPQVAVQPVSAQTVHGESGTVPPPNSVSMSPTEARTTLPRPKQRRASEAPRRAPSPMGERILKGHFDGFN
jgi:hypothetical protein